MTGEQPRGGGQRSRAGESRPGRMWSEGSRPGESPPEESPRDPDVPDLSIVIVSWNTRELLRSCLESIGASTGRLELEVWVVDNGSEDGTADMVQAEFPDVDLIRNDDNRGFAAANNQALRQATARHLLLLNPDTEVEPDALRIALESAEEWGTTVAARLLNPDGTLQHSCFRFPKLWVDFVEAVYLHHLIPPGIRGRLLLGGYWSHDEAREVDWALGAFLLVSREALDAAGLLPEEYPLFGEDMAWCWRLRQAGYPVRYCPGARVVHHGNQSAGQLPPAWRIQKTHATKRIFLRERFGPVRSLLHRWVDVLGYTVRATLFTVMGLWSRRRRAMAREYRRILSVVLSSGHAFSRRDAEES